MPILKIKFFRQTERAYCYPACVKMVIDYAIDSLRVKQRSLRLRKIARELRTDPDAGTSPGDIERVNTLLLDSFPQIQLRGKKMGTFGEIRDEIDQERPVIAWIELVRDEDDILFHAVVVKGYSSDLSKIFYIDPNKTEDDHQCEAEVGDFIDNKLGVEGHLIKLEITLIGQKDLRGRIRPLKRRRETKRKQKQ